MAIFGKNQHFNIIFLCKQYIYKAIVLIEARQRVVPGQPLSLKKGTLLSLSRTVKNDKTSILDAMMVLSKTTLIHFQIISYLIIVCEKEVQI